MTPATPLTAVQSSAAAPRDGAGSGPPLTPRSGALAVGLRVPIACFAMPHDFPSSIADGRFALGGRVARVHRSGATGSPGRLSCIIQRHATNDGCRASGAMDLHADSSDGGMKPLVQPDGRLVRLRDGVRVPSIQPGARSSLGAVQPSIASVERFWPGGAAAHPDPVTTAGSSLVDRRVIPQGKPLLGARVLQNRVVGQEALAAGRVIPASLREPLPLCGPPVCSQQCELPMPPASRPRAMGRYRRAALAGRPRHDTGVTEATRDTSSMIDAVHESIATASGMDRPWGVRAKPEGCPPSWCVTRTPITQPRSGPGGHSANPTARPWHSACPRQSAAPSSEVSSSAGPHSAAPGSAPSGSAASSTAPPLCTVLGGRRGRVG